jgi:para-nitrobenzyl esterase
VAKLVSSCWIAFYKMDPKAKSLTCANGVNWPAYTEGADEALQFKDRPQLVKSQALSNGPPRATNAGG